VNLPQLDQAEMVALRNAWFEQVGGPPTGNKREPTFPLKLHSLSPQPQASPMQGLSMPSLERATQASSAGMHHTRGCTSSAPGQQ
jgi:hypothetical protein